MTKNINRKLAALLAVCMCVLFVAPGFSASAATVAGVSGEQADINGLTATISVSGITEEGVAVTAYQLVDGYYNDNNLVRYVLTDPTNGALVNPEAPTTEEVTAIANNIGAGTFEGEEIVLVANAEGVFEADVEPGLYLVLVSGSTDTVFNPAIIAVNVADANDPVQVTAGQVSMTDFFMVGDTATYVKSSKSDIDKNIVAADGLTIDSSAAATGKGDTVAVGDVIYFEIGNMTIPSFSEDYESPKYIITDTLAAGQFDTIANLKVFVNGVETAAGADTFALVNNGTNFVVDFTEAFLRAHAADATRPTVKITYESALIDASGVNYAENFNNVKLQYSNDPADETSMKEIVKNTYHYTFAINGLLDGGTTFNDDINKIEYNAADERQELAGATFAISMNEDMSDAFAEADSDEFGRFLFTGLDEGVYYVKEIDSPLGYTLNDNVYKVTIAATLDSETGIMTEYTITVESKASNADTWTSEGTMTYTNDVAAVTVDELGNVTNSLASSGATTDVVNAKIWQMPASGGAGIKVALGVSAVLAMATFGLVVIAKKKSNQE